jgi:hypothetical protein
MDRERFDHLLEAYGGDFRRWPAEERAGVAAFVAQNADAAAALKAAQGLDRALDEARNELGDTAALSARILAQAPRAQPWLDRRARLALAACAVFGVLLGYGGGLMAPAMAADDAYFAAAFETLLIGEEG